MPDRNTDERLLESAGAGDAAAFQELYERHRNSVFRFAYRLSGSVENAEDLTHDCFLSLLKRVASFEPRRASLRTYLFAATRNLWLKQLRTLGRESALDEFDENDFVAVSKAPLGRLLDREMSLKVAEAVASLPPLQREALVLFEYEGMSLNEIARMVGSDLGAVKARLHRARERLRKALQPYLNSNREIVTLEKA
ncbi:MAG: RNA polymerase sigma factor [Blastocatellia bacterium]|nr:RNA polymerase sigma factor [Blastocatellia bacterium]